MKKHQQINDLTCSAIAQDYIQKGYTMVASSLFEKDATSMEGTSFTVRIARLDLNKKFVAIGLFSVN